MPPKSAYKEMTRSERKLLLKPSAAVSKLPSKFSNSQKVWWNPYIGAKFTEHKGSKGSTTNNATEYIRETFINVFCPALYPHLSKEEASDYELIIGETVYSYVGNHTANGTPGVQLKKPRERSRSYAYVSWKRDKPEEFKALFDEYLKKHPQTVLVGNRRSISSQLFKDNVSEEEQARYRREAAETFQRVKDLKGLVGSARTQYIQDFPKKMKMIVEEAEKCAGIKLNVQMFSEKEDGNFTLASIAAESLKDFRTSSAMSHLLSSLKSWLQEKSGESISDVPTPAPYPSPDPTQDRKPVLPPNWADLRAAAQQKLCRQYTNLLWANQAGVGKVPWEEISKDPSKWIDPCRMPEGFTWKDPGSFIQQQSILLLSYIRDGADGLLEEGQLPLQFRRVIARRDVIDPSNSQESSRELVTRKGKQVYELVFDDTVTRCHVVGGLKYPKESLEYADFINTRVEDPIDTREPSTPPEWLGLPRGVPAKSDEAFNAAEVADLTDTFNRFKEPTREVLRSFLNAYLQFHSLLPASTLEGIWSTKDGLPALLPPSMPNDPAFNFFSDFWLPLTYYLGPRKCLPNGTFLSFEVWIEELVESRRLIHEQSGTLLGGANGCIWVVRSLLKLFFNLSVIHDDVEPPVARPTEYDTSRLTLEDRNRVFKWITEWNSLLLDSVEILAKTADKRSASVARSSQSPITAPTALESEDEQAAAPTTKNQKRKRPNKVSSAGKAHKRIKPGSESFLDDEELAKSSEDEESSEEEDFGKLDDSANISSEEEDLFDEQSTQPAPLVAHKSKSAKASSDDEEWFDEESTHVEPAPSVARKSKSKSAEAPSDVPDKRSKVAAESGSVSDVENDTGLDIEDKIVPPFCQDFEIEDFIFGGVPSLPPPGSPPCYETYDTVLAAMKKAAVSSTAILDTYHGLASYSDDARLDDLRLARLLVARTPIMTTHEIEFVAQGAIYWARAKSQAPSIFQCARQIFIANQQLVALSLAAREIYTQLVGLCNPLDYDLKALAAEERNLRVLIARLQWTWDEFVICGKLGTGYSQFLEETAGWQKTSRAWIISKRIPETDFFFSAIEGLCIWIRMLEYCTKPFVENRRKIWEITGLPWDDRYTDTMLEVRVLLNKAMRQARDKYNLTEEKHTEMEEEDATSILLTEGEGGASDKWRTALANLGEITPETIIKHPLFPPPRPRARPGPLAQPAPSTANNAPASVSGTPGPGENGSATVEPAPTPIEPVTVQSAASAADDTPASTSGPPDPSENGNATVEPTPTSIEPVTIEPPSESSSNAIDTTRSATESPPVDSGEGPDSAADVVDPADGGSSTAAAVGPKAAENGEPAAVSDIKARRSNKGKPAESESTAADHNPGSTSSKTVSTSKSAPTSKSNAAEHANPTPAVRETRSRKAKKAADQVPAVPRRASKRLSGSTNDGAAKRQRQGKQ